MTRTTNPPPHPDAFAVLIVGPAESSSMTDDGVVLADGATPWQLIQWNYPDYPGSGLSFGSGSAIKRITAGVKARR